jgi:hypothetical protein
MGSPALLTEDEVTFAHDADDAPRAIDDREPADAAGDHQGCRLVYGRLRAHSDHVARHHVLDSHD